MYEGKPVGRKSRFCSGKKCPCTFMSGSGFEEESKSRKFVTARKAGQCSGVSDGCDTFRSTLEPLPLMAGLTPGQTLSKPAASQCPGELSGGAVTSASCRWGWSSKESPENLKTCEPVLQTGKRYGVIFGTHILALRPEGVKSRIEAPQFHCTLVNCSSFPHHMFE